MNVMRSDSQGGLKTIEDVPAMAYRKHLDNPELDYSIAVRHESEQARINIREHLRSRTLERINRGKYPKRSLFSSYSSIYDVPPVRHRRQRKPKMRLGFIKDWFSGKSGR